MIVMGWRRTFYTTKVLLTIKPLGPPYSPFLRSSLLAIPLIPITLRAFSSATHWSEMKLTSIQYIDTSHTPDTLRVRLATAPNFRKISPLHANRSRF
jgi:hypothetical protein